MTSVPVGRFAPSRRRALTALLAVGALAVPACTASEANPPEGQVAIREIALSNPKASPRDVAVGADGTAWVTEQSANRIARIDPSGTVGELPVRGKEPNPFCIAIAEDGTVWFTQYLGNAIGSIVPGKSIRAIGLGAKPVWPIGITISAGTVWFAEVKGHALGRIVPPASIGTVPVPGGKKAAPYRLATGPDGTVWFTDPASNAVGRLIPDGQIVGVQLPTPAATRTTSPSARMASCGSRRPSGTASASSTRQAS